MSIMSKFIYLSLLLLSLPTMASAYFAEIDGICYDCFGKEATLTSGETYNGETIVIPASITYNGKTYRVTKIGDKAFWRCSSLTSVTIPESVTIVGESAFYGCSSMKKVIVSDLEAWCNIKFNGSYSNPLSIAHHLFVNETTEVSDLSIPDGVTSIGSYAFSGCSGLTSVTLPNSLTTIGERAFYGCGIKKLSVPYGVWSIGDYAFSLCPLNTI